MSIPGVRRDSEAARPRDLDLGGIAVLGQTRPSSTTVQVRRAPHDKSARYTVRHPLLLGGTLGGATADLLSCCSAFGIQAGEAFQLRDDVLAVDRVEQRIDHLASGALAVLADVPVDDRVRRALAALTDACAWRTA